MLLADDLNGLGADAIARDERVRAFDRLAGPAPGHAHARHGDQDRAAGWRDHRRHRPGRAAGPHLAMHVQSVRIDTGRISLEFDERGRLDDLLAIVERAARRLVPAGVARPPPGRAAALAAGLRAVRQGAAGRDAGRTSRLSRKGAVAGARVRPRASGTRPRARRDRRVAQGAQTPRWRCRAGSRYAARAQLEARRRRDRAHAVRRGVHSAEGAGRPDRRAGSVQQSRRDSAAARRDRAKRTRRRTSSTRPSRPIPPRPTTPSTWATPTGGSRITRRRCIGCARPCDASPATATRTSCSPPRCRPPAPPPRRPGSASWRGACRPRTKSRRGTAQPDTVPADLERLRPYLDPPGARRTDSALMATEQRGQRELVAFHLERGRRFFERDSDRDALDRAAARRLSVALSGRGAPADRAHPPPGRAGPRGGGGVQDRAVERRVGCRARGAGRSLSPGEGSWPAPGSKPNARWRCRARPARGAGAARAA